MPALRVLVSVRALRTGVSLMARYYECTGCEHVQMVRVLDNGLPAGYADPRTVCENCGAKGKFHFAPGTYARIRRDAKIIADALHRQAESRGSR